jgi:hypothetical protein
MTNVSAAGAPIVTTANRHLVEQGRAPPLAGHRPRPGESLLRVGACLGLLVCRDDGFCVRPHVSNQ